jgi:type I restriction enzyme S subunit
MKSNYKRIGDYIRLVDERNTGLEVPNLLGLTIAKTFIPSVANIIGANMENYKIIRRNQFACSTMQVRRDRKMPVALLTDTDEAIISQAYPVFEVADEKQLLPEYLMMWFSRKEFDREACFYAIGGVRGSLEWVDFCDMRLPVPPIGKQCEIVAEYHAVQKRIALNNQLIQTLEATAQAIYKQWFVDFEFPDAEGKSYKSNGGEMDESEMGEVPKGWRVDCLGNICDCLDSQRKPLSELERNEMKGIYPYYGAMSIVDYIDKYVYNGIYLLFSEDGANVIDTEGHPALQYIWGKFWVNNHAHVLQGNNNVSTEFLYISLKNAIVPHLVTGAAQPKINQENMNSIELIVPTEKMLNKFNQLGRPIFGNIQVATEINNELFRLQELLLAKMAKGE